MKILAWAGPVGLVGRVARSHAVWKEQEIGKENVQDRSLNYYLCRENNYLYFFTCLVHLLKA